MGVFPEDEEILAFILIPLWVAEGFIKSFDGKSLEEAAEDCIEELVDRNLVIVEKRDYYGQVEVLKMHDLLRDLALREGEKDKFLYAVKGSTDKEISQGIISTQHRRIATMFKDKEYPPYTLLESPSSSLVRTLIGENPYTLSLSSFRLLRVCLVEGDICEYSMIVGESNYVYYEEIFIPPVNLRFLLVDLLSASSSEIFSASSSLWNLQTLILEGDGKDFVLEIWKMSQLRHVIAWNGAICVPDRSMSCDVMDEVVLENLHTLFTVRNLNLGEEVLKRIPNINTLELQYDETREESGDYYCLRNLHGLRKLQALGLTISDSSSSRELTLPYFLKKLTLKNTKLPWEDMKTKIGCLPLLQLLELEHNSFTGSEWETVEGQFSSLKFLDIEDCSDLEYWITDNSHFPRLEHLVLRRLKELREIPSSIGDIPTLRSIKLHDCRASAVDSARRIREEQEEYGNELLQIQVNGQSIR